MVQKVTLREPLHMPNNNSREPDFSILNLYNENELRRSRTSRENRCSSRFAIYKINAPSRSRGSFVPSCSTLPCQLEPRK
jgi:hypothetical protein